MKRVIRDTVILLAITAIAAVGLSFVYELTKEPIALAEQQATAAAYQQVYTDAVSFNSVADSAQLLQTFNASLSDGTYIEQVYAAIASDGTQLGYVMTAVSNGYAGEVAIALGIDTAATVVGYDVLRHSETPGFGANAENADVAAQFPGITSADQIDGISGATYTTNALKAATQASLDLVKQLEEVAQ